jgi:hypothetical protein
MSNEPIGSPFPTGFHTNHMTIEAEPMVPPPPPPWRWSWSIWVGIKYGPVPVGLIVALPIIIARAI